MFFDSRYPMQRRELNELSLRLVAHLGDAVFELFERERELLGSATAEKLHHKVVKRVNAAAQSRILDRLAEHLSDGEKDIVRRARNIKPSYSRRSDQRNYRKSTAFEALIGYLYLSDRTRLEQILRLSLSLTEPDAVNTADAGDETADDPDDSNP